MTATPIQIRMKLLLKVGVRKGINKREGGRLGYKNLMLIFCCTKPLCQT